MILLMLTYVVILEKKLSIVKDRWQQQPKWIQKALSISLKTIVVYSCESGGDGRGDGSI